MFVCMLLRDSIAKGEKLKWKIQTANLKFNRKDGVQVQVGAHTASHRH